MLAQSGCLGHSDRYLRGRDRLFREIRNAGAVDGALVRETAAGLRRDERPARRPEAYPARVLAHLIVARYADNHTAIELPTPW
jgi:hypothetical protein